MRRLNIRLTGGSPAEGSAGYVAIERVTAAVQGRSGSFLLQHSGTMTPTSQDSTITVVPVSGTGELEGIAGTMSIEIKDGKHFYDFEYTLPSLASAGDLQSGRGREDRPHVDRQDVRGRTRGYQPR